MVLDAQELFIILDENEGYRLDHIYLDAASAELALMTYFTPTRVQEGRVRVERIEAKRLEHCCQV